MKALTSLLTGAALVVGLSASAQDAAALDLSGKTVTWVVPFKEGGGSDSLARLMAPYLQEALPGNPSIVILNQPGGGSITSANRFNRGAETDGTMIFIGSSSTFLPVALQGEAVRFDPNEWRALMALPRGTVFYADPKKVAVKPGDDAATMAGALKDADLVLGAKAPTSIELIDMVSLDLLGADLQPVFGLSSSKQRQAFLRGELNINHDGTGPYLRKMSEHVEAGEVVPLYSYGYRAADGSINRDPDASDLPTFDEVLEQVDADKKTTVGFEAYQNLMNVKVSISKVIFLPEEASDEVYQTYLEAFETIAANEELAKALKKEVGSLPVSFGEDAAAAVAAGTQMSDEARAYVNEMLSSKYGASL